MIQAYPFDDSLNYTYDSDKIEISGGIAKLLLQQANVNFIEDFANDTGFIYDNTKAEFASGMVRQKDQIDAISGANFNTDINLEDWSRGVVTGTAHNGAAIISGKLDLSGSTNKYIDFDANDNADMQQTGCIKFKWTPKYSGAGSFQYLFTIVHGAGNANNRIRMYHQSTLLFVAISDSVGGSIVSFAEAFSPVADTEYEIELNFDITTGETRLFVDGVQLGTTQTGTGIRNSDIGLLRLGKDLNGNGNADFLIDDLIIFDTVQHTSNYTKGYSVPDFQYVETSVILPEMEHIGDGSIKLFNSLVSVYAGSPRILIEIGRSGNKLYWNGSAWVVSDETYIQATDPVTFNTNCASLPVDGEKYGQFTIIFSDSNIVSSYDTLTANMNVDIGYSTLNPAIEPNTSFMADTLISFVESSTLTGNDLFKYIFKKGTKWYWLNNGTLEESDETYSQSNTPAEITANIDLIITAGATIKIKIFVHSGDGTTNPELDTVTIDYSFYDFPETLNECIIWGYNFKNDGTPDTSPFDIQLSSDVVKYKNETILRNDIITVTPDENGYWEQGLIENDNMEDGIFYTFIFSELEDRQVFVPNELSKNYWELTERS